MVWQAEALNRLTMRDSLPADGFELAQCPNQTMFAAKALLDHRSLVKPTGKPWYGGISVVELGLRADEP